MKTQTRVLFTVSFVILGVILFQTHSSQKDAKKMEITSIENNPSDHHNEIKSSNSNPLTSSTEDPHKSNNQNLEKKTKPALSERNSKNNCWTHEYRHPASARARDLEEYLELTNAFPIQENANLETLCVKVNQKVVKYKLSKREGKPEILIHGEVGPESLIRISYCSQKASCKEKCETSHPSLTDDLLSETPGDDEFKASWGEDPEQIKELQEKTRELRSIATESESLNQNSIERNWEVIQQQESFCKK